MKGNPKLIEELNSLLADELTAINQYMVHSEMCENWGHGKLHADIQKRAITEMKHAEKLIERILFLDGRPVVSDLRKITIGQDVPAQLGNDLGLELGAIKSYNDAVKLAVTVGDNATKEILEDILKDEDGHVDGLETQQGQVEMLGLPNFLVVWT